MTTSPDICRSSKQYIWAGMLLVLGGGIYLLLRPTGLQMFRWVDCMGLRPGLDVLRETVAGWSLPAFLVYNAPAALWVLSYMLAIDTVWSGSGDKGARQPFLWALPAAAVVLETAQLWACFSGTFDPLDLAAYLSAVFIYLLINRLRK